MNMSPRRGEVWDVDFAPSVGAEIKKARPAAVLSVQSVGRLPLRIVVPITDWKDNYAGIPWMTYLAPTNGNGLTKGSAADAFQVKSVGLPRFQIQRGHLTPREIEDIAAAVVLCVGYV